MFLNGTTMVNLSYPILSYHDVHYSSFVVRHRVICHASFQSCRLSSVVSYHLSTIFPVSVVVIKIKEAKRKENVSISNK